MEIRIRESEVMKAAREGMDAFVELFRDHILEAIGGELNAQTMPLLAPDQITLLAYMRVREEVMDGGFVQLIHNGYGPFIFLNPFAKAMRLWGIKEMTNLISLRSTRRNSRANVPTRSSWHSSNSTLSSTNWMTSS